MGMIRQNSPYILIQTKFQYISLALWFWNTERGQFWSRSCAAFNYLHLSKNDMLHKHRACFGILIQLFGFANDPTSPFNTGAGEVLLKKTFIMYIKCFNANRTGKITHFKSFLVFLFFPVWWTETFSITFHYILLASPKLGAIYGNYSIHVWELQSKVSGLVWEENFDWKLVIHIVLFSAWQSWRLTSSVLDISD